MKVRPLEKIAADGLDLLRRDSPLADLSLLSLRIGLKSYFSTYKTMKYGLHLFNEEDRKDPKTVDFNHPSSYWTACSEAILHFQHFAELVCKELLRTEHALLAIDATSRPIIFHKLLTGEPVQEADYLNVKTLQFSEALQSLCELVKERKLGGGQYDFFLAYREALVGLNSLRNRIWHRGTFVLRYPALDELFGRYLLPFMQNCVTLKQFAESESAWKYSNLSCGLDPIDLIVAELAGPDFDLRKIALLKELGRAAYMNPTARYKFDEYFAVQLRHRAERIASTEQHERNVSRTTNCPVCGAQSLVVYDDVEAEDEDQETGKYSKACRYTWQVKCLLCSFEINHHLDNPKKYGLPLEDYWTSEEL
jgi:hypothetical protein